MFDDKPEISDTLEWMLQSRQVGDETLVNTMVNEQYAGLNSFSLSVLPPSYSDLAQRLTEKVITSAVENASQYQQDIRVKVWLLHRAYQIYLSWISSKVVRKKTPINKHEFDCGQSSASDSETVWIAIDQMAEDIRLAFILRYHQVLTLDEIAYVMDISESDVGSKIAAAEGSINLRTDDEQESQFTPEGMRYILSQRWNAPLLSPQNEKKITRRIMGTLNANERRKHRAVIIGELVLVIIAILIVAGMGNTLASISPQPTPQEPVRQTQLVNQIVYISPTPFPTPLPTPFPEFGILYIAVEGETIRDIAMRMFLNVEIIAALNNFPPDQALSGGQKIMIGVRDSQVLMPTNVGSTQQPTPTIALSDPLTLGSSADEIRQRILGSRLTWYTVWADAVILQYGPPGYIGQPDVRRQQVWINQPYFSYLIDGGYGGVVESIYSALGGLITYTNLETGEQLTNTETELVHYSQNLHQLLLPSEFRDNFSGEINVLGVGQIADRDALVLDWYTLDNILEGGTGESERRLLQGRYWVDTLTGVILRRQRFNANDIDQLFEDTVIDKIEFNFDIPHRLYDRSQPSQTYFAQDYRGDPESGTDSLQTQVWSPQTARTPIPRIPAPEDYDPTHGYLTFQWTSLSEFTPNLGTYVDIFADGYYLDNIEFADPYQIICTRSSDGEKIAFTGWSDETIFGYAPLRWFSLSDLPNVNQALDEIVPYDFAFAPDNKQLAVYGCHRYEEGGSCGILILDTESGESRWLTDVERGSGLIWSPDGESLVIQGSLLRAGKWRVLVFDTRTGNVTYDGPFDWEGFWVSPDTPLYEWDIELPPRKGGLEICSQPPEVK